MILFIGTMMVFLFLALICFLGETIKHPRSFYKGSENESSKWTYRGTQTLVADCPTLAKIQQNWTILPEHLKMAILEI